MIRHNIGGAISDNVPSISAVACTQTKFTNEKQILKLWKIYT